MAKSSCPTRGASLLCIRKPSIASAVTAAVSSASARQNISTCTRSPPAWAILRPLSRGQAANRARYRSRYLGPSRRGRAGSRDRQQRNQRGRGAAEALPALPDFEFVPRRSRNSSLAADHLAEMIINFFQLSTALRPGDGMNYKQRRISCCGPASRPRIALTRASGSPRWRGVSVRKNRGSDWRGSSS